MTRAELEHQVWVLPDSKIAAWRLLLWKARLAECRLVRRGWRRWIWWVA